MPLLALINVPFPCALVGALNAVIPSELLFLDVEAIVWHKWYQWQN